MDLTPRVAVLRAIAIIDRLVPTDAAATAVRGEAARAAVKEAVRVLDSILERIEPERFRPADAPGAPGTAESQIIEKIMRTINTIDAKSIKNLDERMRVNYVVNGMTLLRITDDTKTKMSWCLDMMRRIKVAMTNA